MNNTNEDCIFSYMQKVKIINGFYKGYYGKVINYNMKEDSITVKIMINDRDEDIKCKVKDLVKQKLLFGLF